MAQDKGDVRRRRKRPAVDPPDPQIYEPLGPIRPEVAQEAMRDRQWAQPWIKGSPDYPFIPSPNFEKWRKQGR